MCGIFFAASAAHIGSDEEIIGDSELSGDFITLCDKLQVADSARGPDSKNVKRHFLPKGPTQDSFVGNILNSGESTERQGLAIEFFASELLLRGVSPIVQPHEKDGNILCFNGEIFEGLDVSPEENDGVKLFNALCKLRTSEEWRDLVGSIEGPYAFVFYHFASHRLFFARDPLGRRSLLIHTPSMDSPYFLLSSVSAGPDPLCDFKELSTDFVYCLDLHRLSKAENIDTGFLACLTEIPRQRSNPQISSPLPFAEPHRVEPLTPTKDSPKAQSLDDEPEFLTRAINELIYHLNNSVMFRVSNIPRSLNVKRQARVAVLFSGGIDSTILAYFAHQHLPTDEPIDLLNVAFENPRKIKIQTEGNPGGLTKQKKKEHSRNALNSAVETSYMVPDRITGLQEVEELRKLCPGRLWNFVEVNVPYEESQAARSTVESIMLPGRTVMDLSLALALYFASRGIGKIRSRPDGEYEPYTSPARVLLNGLGSDELLGGYGRHRSAFNNGGWPAVVEELQLEIDRLPTRNLGRDDRIISSHGKETRHPFLSLTVVKFLAQLPVHLKLDPRLELGLGDKMLLRFAARRVGLVEASSRKKRAMQFGSHSARMDGEKRGDGLLS